MIPSCFFHCQNVRTRMSACPLATYSFSQISWLTSRLVPRSASESISSSSCGYASHTAWRFRCERGFQQHQTRRPKTSKTSLGIVQRLLLSTKGIYITTEISCALTLQPTLQSCCEFEPSDTVHISSCYDVAALFQKVTEFRRVWLASYQTISPSSWSCLHSGFAADYLQCRHQGRSTQVLSSSRELTFIFDTHVLPQENRAACVSTCPRYAS